MKVEMASYNQGFDWNFLQKKKKRKKNSEKLHVA